MKIEKALSIKKIVKVESTSSSGSVKANPFGAALRAPARMSGTAASLDKPKQDAAAKPVNMFLQKIQKEKELKLQMQKNLGDQMKK